MDRRIREAIEACRPASDDLHDADLTDAARAVQDDPQARLDYERVQHYDAAIVKSIDDVPIPAGLEERILARLRAAEGEPLNGRNDELLAGVVTAATGEQPAAGQPATEPHVVPAPRRFGMPRRRSSVAALAAVLSCVMIVAAYSLWPEPGEEDLVTLAERWQGGMNDKWESMDDAPHELPVPAGALHVAPARWQWISHYAKHPVVAYELNDPRAGKATLYVAKMKREGLRSSPPLKPQSNSRKVVAYWQSGSCVYVLVVDNERDYQRFVRPSTAPVA